MRKNIFLFLPFCCLFFSCSNKHTQKIKGQIFERKQLPDGSLMVYYTFAKDGSLLKDSAALKNTIVLKDSVEVEYSFGSPEKTKLLLH